MFFFWVLEQESIKSPLLLEPGMSASPGSAPVSLPSADGAVEALRKAGVSEERMRERWLRMAVDR